MKEHNSNMNHKEMDHSKHENMNHHNHTDMKPTNHEHEHHHHQMNSNQTKHEDMDHSGHEGMDHSGHENIFKTKFIVSLFLGIPILVLSPIMGIQLPFQVTFSGSQWLIVILASVLFLYGGSPFIKGAKHELKNRQPGMMMLITLGISVSYSYSMYAFIMNEIIHGPEHVMDFFWELTTLILIMLLGHWIEIKAVTNAGNALQKMAELLPSDALVLKKDGSTVSIPLRDVKIGDTIFVKAGENMPVDGIIIDGKTSVNEAMVTGESKLINKEPSDKVIGGSINGNGSIKVEVTGTGESGYLGQVMALVDKASKEKSRVESLADKVAKWLFYIALAVGVLTLIVWTGVSNISVAVERAVTVLIIACPHALGLAIPLVVARSTSLGAQNGLLVKTRQALETAQHVDVIMMDKTGTLTEGNFVVSDYRSFNSAYTNEQVLQYLASLEVNSSHPLAVGIIEKVKSEKIDLLEAKNIDTIPGIGLHGFINGKDVKITSVKYLDTNNIEYDKDAFKELSSKGNSISFLIVDNMNIGWVAQGDEIKPDSKRMIEKLKNLGITPIMLTGDNKQVASLTAQNLGIDNVHAELMPEDKERIISEYKNKGLKVIMVGDGVNDAPSLTRADVGIAIGAGTDVAIDSADIILVKSNPLDILNFLSLAKNTSKKMKENLWWGTGYNIIAIPLAAGILAGIGIILSPAIGAIFMSLSTIIVAFNAMLLKLN